jgi:cell division protein FtsI (penicillin-binding protein 3)
MGIRRSIISRIAIVYFVLLLFGVVVVLKMISVQQIKNDRWENIARNLKENTVIVEPNRGNICADDGSVLATSVPGYFVRIDLAAEGVKKVYKNESDSLAYYLSRYFRDASSQEYKRRLNNAYSKKNRGFMLTPRKVDYTELQDIKKFPILRRGRYGGGLIIEQENKRVTPLGNLAFRTIGGLNKGVEGGIHGNIGYTGLEGAYEKYLRGEDGIGYRQNLSGRWVTRAEIEPKDGKDIVTTINVKIQDITQSALYSQLKNTNAEWATAIVMEVKTGDIKAIANLGLENGDYYENYNYALGHAGCYEPGSTFKLISLMAALEDGLVDTSDVFDTSNGLWQYKGRNIKDSDYGHISRGEITLKEIFEISSNVGVAKIITHCYESDPKKYVDRVYSFGVNKPLGVEVPGEGIPFFKYPGDKDWWGTSLAWMSYGYETKMTPLQILAFYNAVANDGKLVKPRLVKEIRDNGATEERFKTEVLNSRIASKSTIGKAQKMLEGVCETGTGKSLKNPYFKIAGKTGTAQISGAGGYQKGMYLASFAGYFPADNPKYSIIVTFNNPRGGAYYGGSVAGPVFKEIAEKIYASQMMIEEDYEEEYDENEIILPDIKKGNTKDIIRIADKLNLRNIEGRPETLLASVKKENDQIILVDNEITEGIVPDVRGMGASNAVFLLENLGLRVNINGVGKVKSQSMSPGTKCKPGQTVSITLG